VSRDEKTIAGFGDEWSRFDQSGADARDLTAAFNAYFTLFPWQELPPEACGLDLGCGSGRWARMVAKRVGRVICVEPSAHALNVARRTADQCLFIQGAAGELPFRENTMDFCYSLGVLHHTPQPAAGLADAVRCLKPGAPVLVYLYYAFDNRPAWFRSLWRASDAGRVLISRLPNGLRYWITQVIAAVVYYPLARLASFVERAGRSVERFPLSAYRHCNFYMMRNDALDRFGTRLEKRFTEAEVLGLLEGAGLERVTVGGPPFWSGLGFKPSPQ